MPRFYYGGQAVVEGVMMRGRQSVAVAVRRPDEEITVYEEALPPRLYQNILFKLPFLRGILLLWDMLGLGSRMMTLAVNIAAGTVEAESGTADADVSVSSQHEEIPEAVQEPQPPAIGGVSLAVTVLFSLTLAVGIFFVLPLLLATLLRPVIGSGFWNVILEGVIRLTFLIAYLLIIGRFADVQRLFGYHGAEHKAINALEAGDPLDVAHVRRASRVHTRCGTGFLLLVMVVSTIVFACIGSSVFWLNLLLRIVLVPVVAAISYELMRLGAANYRFRIVRWLLAPGLALQGLTTREPDDSMIECAIASLRCVLVRDGEPEPTVDRFAVL